MTLKFGREQQQKLELKDVFLLCLPLEIHLSERSTVIQKLHIQSKLVVPSTKPGCVWEVPVVSGRLGKGACVTGMCRWLN